MRFAVPHALWLLVLLPAMWLAWRGRAAGGVGFSLVTATVDLPHGIAVHAARALPWLRLLAVALAIVALARPQYGVQQTRVYREGISVVMVVDVSSSMAAIDLSAEDTTRSRLDVVKTAFRGFVEGRGDSNGDSADLVGMVSFAKFASVLAPLSSDHDALLALLDDLSLVELADEDGTAIGDAMATALDVFDDADEGGRVMIVLTDGADNAGETFPRVAAEAARALGVRVYTIGAGTRGTAMTPVGNSGRLRPTRVNIDDAGLSEVAEIGGGRYFRAEDAKALEAIYAEIDELEKASHAVERFQRYVEGFPLFALLAALILLAEQLLRATRLRVVTAA